ncbi:hypothetical protein K438DRAFT_1937290 [Mycena galopus ATCC 62051]|nr:hypothetical protein K438DRAFT_1937290 [Mycena galopus ATCC 62051]
MVIASWEFELEYFPFADFVKREPRACDLGEGSPATFNLVENPHLPFSASGGCLFPRYFPSPSERAHQSLVTLPLSTSTNFLTSLTPQRATKKNAFNAVLLPRGAGGWVLATQGDRRPGMASAYMKVAKTQDAGLSDYELRDLNDDIKKQMREKRN